MHKTKSITIFFSESVLWKNKLCIFNKNGPFMISITHPIFNRKKFSRGSRSYLVLGASLLHILFQMASKVPLTTKVPMATKVLNLQPQSFYRSLEQFFLTECQNNFCKQNVYHFQRDVLRLRTTKTTATFMHVWVP